MLKKFYLFVRKGPKVEQELDFFTYILLDIQYIMSENCMDCHFNSSLIQARINRDYTDVS
jgi:hypothetical protein